MDKKKCPKCKGNMEEKSGWHHNVVVRSRIMISLGKRPKMYVCENCGYIEFYLD